MTIDSNRSNAQRAARQAAARRRAESEAGASSRTSRQAGSTRPARLSSQGGRSSQEGRTGYQAGQSRYYSSSGSYRNGGPYGHDGKSTSLYQRSNVAKYTRSTYSSGETAERRRKNLILAIVAAAVVAACVFGVFTYLHTRPLDVVVNGRSVEVAYNTTYQDLHDQGLLTEGNGNLLAVDGSVLSEGEGSIYKIFDNEVLVDDYSRRLKSGSVVTEAKGDDITEDYEVNQTTVPWTTVSTDSSNFNFYNGSLHFYVSEGVDGVSVTHTGKVSGITVDAPDESTVMVPREFLSVTYSPTDGSKVVALTFDDGPSQYTQQVLDVLNRYGVKATFFELGSNVVQLPNVTKAVADAGMQIGSHGYDHGGASNPYLSEMSDEQLINDLTMAQNAIKDASGVVTTVVRPSGGNVTFHNIEAAGDLMTVCTGWNVDTEDWSRPGVDAIVDNVLTNVRPGSVVLMHDGGGDRTQTIAALETVIPALQEKGYTFVTIDELVEFERQSYVSSLGTQTGA